MGNTFSDFESFCNRVRSNDPTADTVNTDNFPYFESEEAAKLGDALLLVDAGGGQGNGGGANNRGGNNDQRAQNYNHHVRQIIMDVTNLDLRHDRRGVQSIARFLRTSQSMRALYLKSPGLPGQYAAGGAYHHNNNNRQLAQQRRTVANVVAALIRAVATSDTIDEVVFGNVDLTTPVAALSKLLLDAEEEEGDESYKCTVKRLRISFGREVTTAQQARILTKAFGDNHSLQACELAGLPDGTFKACMQGLQDNASMTTLRLDRIGGESDNQALAQLVEHNTTMICLSIAQTNGLNIPTLVTSLLRNDTLTDLALVECHLMTQDAPHIKRVVVHCPSMQSLSLSKNFLENEGFAEIASGLHRNRSIIFFDISENGIGGPQASIILRDLCRRNRHLTRLDMDRNHLGSAMEYRYHGYGGDTRRTIRPLPYAQGLARNSTLQEVDFSHCALDDGSAEAIATQCLTQNTTLSVLAVARNDISHVGVQHIVTAMRVSKSITALALSYNNVGDEGIVILATLLRDNATPLAKLFLDETQFGNVGALALADSMQVNTSLTVLSVEDNRFDRTGVTALLRALPNATCPLQRLDFSWRHDYYHAHNNNNSNSTTTRIRALGQGIIVEHNVPQPAAANEDDEDYVNLEELLQSSLITNTTLVAVNVAGYKPKPKERKHMDFCASRNRLLPLVQGPQRQEENGPAASAVAPAAAAQAAEDNEESTTDTSSTTAATATATASMPMELWPNVLARYTTEPNPKHEPSAVYWLLSEVLVSIGQYAAARPRAGGTTGNNDDGAASAAAAASSAVAAADVDAVVGTSTATDATATDATATDATSATSSTTTTTTAPVAARATTGSSSAKRRRTGSATTTATSSGQAAVRARASVQGSASTTSNKATKTRRSSSGTTRPGGKRKRKRNNS